MQTMKLSPESLARASSRHPWRTLGVWFVLIAAMGAISSALLSGVLNQDISFTNKPESVKAQDILDSRFTTPGTKAVRLVKFPRTIGRFSICALVTANERSPLCV